MIFNKPKFGEKRVRSYFSLLPISANYLYGGNIETRWLCFVSVYQIYDQDGWRNECFIE